MWLSVNDQAIEFCRNIYLVVVIGFSTDLQFQYLCVDIKQIGSAWIVSPKVHTSCYTFQYCTNCQGVIILTETDRTNQLTSNPMLI